MSIFNDPLQQQAFNLLNPTSSANNLSLLQQADAIREQNALDTLAQQQRAQQELTTQKRNPREGFINFLDLLSDTGLRFQGKNPLAVKEAEKKLLRDAEDENRKRQLIASLPEDIQRIYGVYGPDAAFKAQYGTKDATNLTTDQKNYGLAVQQGYKGTFMDYMKDKKSPLVNIEDKSESEFQKEATKSAFKIINEATKQVNDFADIEGRLGILQKQLQGGNLETGIFEEMKIPFKRLAAGLNILSQDELDSLDAQELFQRTVNFIVPRLRVSGSGSTSDTEVRLFRESAPALSLTQGGNLLIVGGMSAIAKHNRKRLNLMNKYIEDEKLGNGDLIGFGEYADQELGPVFKSYNSDESFDKQVKEGKLKAGDFVFDGIYGDFRILTEDEVKGIK